ncbi:S24 family peptidase, partial [Methylobacterium sp. yr668]|uniref:LexA family protein n=1 Tax=Methylobacterium sp. yr668 TaxID=1761801 RepID=UPI0008DFA185
PQAWVASSTSIRPPGSKAIPKGGPLHWGRITGIYDRDLASVDRSLKAGYGSIVVAAIDGEMSCKRLVIDGNVARLAFCNPDLPAFAVDECGEGAIWGVVRFSIRWHVARGHMT